MNPEEAVQKSMMLRKVRKNEKDLVHGHHFEKVIRRQQESKSAKEVRVEKVMRLRTKEEALSKAVGMKGMKVTVGRFGILDDSSDDEEPSRPDIAPTTITPKPPVSTAPSNKAVKVKKGKSVEKSKNNVLVYFTSLAIATLAIFLTWDFLVKKLKF